jgi:hypothetical protein
VEPPSTMAPVLPAIIAYKSEPTAIPQVSRLAELLLVSAGRKMWSAGSEWKLVYTKVRLLSNVSVCM